MLYIVHISQYESDHCRVATVRGKVREKKNFEIFGGVGWGWLRGRYSKTFQGMDYSRFPEAGEQILGEITNIFIIRGHLSPLKMGNVGKVVNVLSSCWLFNSGSFFLVVLS